MKSERRHELQQNDLDAELGKVLGWLKRNANRLITVVLVVLVIWLGWTWYQRRQNAQAAQMQANYEAFLVNVQAVNPGERVEEIAAAGIEIANSADPELAASALVEVANFRVRQAVLAEAPEAHDAQIGKAKELYERVLKQYPSDRPMVALAHIGLAKLAWDNGDLDAARAQAAQAAETPGLEGHPVKVQADGLVARLDEIKTVAVLGTWKPDWEDEQTATDRTQDPSAPTSQPTTTPLGDSPAPASAPAAAPASQPEAPTSSGE